MIFLSGFGGDFSLETLILVKVVVVQSRSSEVVMSVSITAFLDPRRRSGSALRCSCLFLVQFLSPPLKLLRSVRSERWTETLGGQTNQVRTPKDAMENFTVNFILLNAFKMFGFISVNKYICQVGLEKVM